MADHILKRSLIGSAHHILKRLVMGVGPKKGEGASFILPDSPKAVCGGSGRFMLGGKLEGRG